jgi:hypothetical protein
MSSSKPAFLWLAIGLVFAFSLFITVSALGSEISSGDSQADIDKDWENFKATFKRNYTAEEDAIHKQYFVEIRTKVKEQHLKFANNESTFDMELNKFADQSPQELSHLHGAIPPVDKPLPPMNNSIQAGERGPVARIPLIKSAGPVVADVNATSNMVGVNPGKTIVLSEEDDPASVDHDWEAFKAAFGRNYSGPEDAKRKAAFAANRLKVKENHKDYEAHKVSYTITINQFSDKLPEELEQLNNLRPPANLTHPTVVPHPPAPSANITVTDNSISDNGYGGSSAGGLSFAGFQAVFFGSALSCLLAAAF